MNSVPQLSGLTESIGKDIGSEERWARLNELLVDAEARLEATVSSPEKPLVFILGPPRSGSTLVSQILAATGCFAATTNFVARFWQAPAFGMQLERAFDIGGEPSFRSDRGRTVGAAEPHEFGYYWSRWFDVGQDTHSLTPDQLETINVGALRKSIAAMEAVAGRPLMFKNNTWFSLQASWLAQNFPTARFVDCSRDPFFVAQSIYAQRTKQGDLEKWWSMRPPSYAKLKHLPVMEQIVEQVVEIQEGISRELEKISPDRVIVARYNEVCLSPRGFAAQVISGCALNQAEAHGLEELPQNFPNTNKVHLPAAVADQLRAAVRNRLAR